VLALRALRSSQREAVVLTLYLDLSEEEAAAITGASQAALRRALASAVRTLRAELAAET
jgi:DNA-directed RNA polymerase specialized sigma24 family protein